MLFYALYTERESNNVCKIFFPGNGGVFFEIMMQTRKRERARSYWQVA